MHADADVQDTAAKDPVWPPLPAADPIGPAAAPGDRRAGGRAGAEDAPAGGVTTSTASAPRAIAAKAAANLPGRNLDADPVKMIKTHPRGSSDLKPGSTHYRFRARACHGRTERCSTR